MSFLIPLVLPRFYLLIASIRSILIWIKTHCRRGEYYTHIYTSRNMYSSSVQLVKFNLMVIDYATRVFNWSSADRSAAFKILVVSKMTDNTIVPHAREAINDTYFSYPSRIYVPNVLYHEPFFFFFHECSLCVSLFITARG